MIQSCDMFNFSLFVDFPHFAFCFQLHQSFLKSILGSITHLPYQIVQVNLAGQWQPFKISLYYFISHQIICKLYTWFFPGFCQSSVVSLTISCLAFIDWWLMPELFSVHTWSNENSFINIATFYFWLKFSQIIWESKLIFSFERSGHHMWLC